MTVDFGLLADDFLAITADVVYATVSTVDERGRPRSRVMHPIFEVVDGRPRGWLLTDRTPVKQRHLAAHPYVTCFYWSPAQATVAVESDASWVEDRERLEEAWDIFGGPPPVGWGDLSGYEPGRIDHPLFHVVELVPYRVQVLTAAQFARGVFTPQTWERG